MAESVWEELLNLNLEFIMSTDDLKNREHNNEYKDGLVKWSEINYAENGYKTILPNNTPTDTDYFVFGILYYTYIIKKDYFIEYASARIHKL